jgi:hypothetical protein
MVPDRVRRPLARRDEVSPSGHRARTGRGRPRIPPVEPDIFVTQGDYQHADADELLDQLGLNIDRLAALLDSLDNKAAQRTVVVERPPRTVDISFVARSALHEGVHHRGYLKRLCYAER